MALPRKLKYLNMFNDGLSYMGVVESVALPKLTRKLENYRGGGMNGAAPIDPDLDDDALSGFKRVIDEQYWLISKVNNNGFTTGLELEVKLSDVEYSSEENED